MDRHRGDRYGDFSDPHRNSHSATSSWSAEDSVTHHDRNYDNQRGDFSNDGHHFHHHHYHNHDHHHHHHISNDRHNYIFNSELNDSSGIGNGNGDIGSGHSGRKRHFSHSGHGTSPDFDGGSYVKLYVGAISRTSTEEDIRSLFEEHGHIVEVVLLKDKRTGQQQECCFVKYATLEEADRAIGALHNQYTFPGGVVPIKVRYAEGERERLGGFGEKYKLYVGGLNKQASKREVEEIFSPYGLVEDVYIVRDELKQNRGCGFIQFSHRNMAAAAINALNGTYVMRGCDQALVVRFADPKKPRTGESRSNSRFGGQGFGPRYQEPVVRPAPYLSDSTSGHVIPNSLHPPSPKSVASSSQGGPIGVIGGSASGTHLGHGLPCSAIQSPQIGSKSQTVSSSSSALELVPSTISSASAVSMSTQTAGTLDCDWSEHTCPDGYKYYYNCVTCESRWEMPKEYVCYEEQLQKQLQQQNLSCQQPHCLSNPQVPFTQPVSQMQSVQPQTTLSNEKLQQPSLSAPEHDHVQMQAATSPVVATACV